ncbi:hypothetical protein A9W99_23555 [Mycobacterium sp. 1164966.3]|uniref:hypothetical protein n=1 Tax=Mycobacterium sp. 1164966.3 TaxID=1856861 RepID=UPI0007FF41E8|nr:hypothetical protein [Mycobacterium sp. 1164966.3]OBA78645.1 hypothetical protein A9W99_23555 [Mycobacterium sp. 1164966.3]
MWTRFVLQPWWGRALVGACGYGVFDAFNWGANGLEADPHEPWLLTLAWHVAGIGVFGLLVALFTDSTHISCNNALAGLNSQQRSAAIDATFRGPAPADPAVREAAIRLAARKVYSARFWTSNCRVLLVLIVLFAVLGLAVGTWPSGWHSDDWISCAALLSVMLVGWHSSAATKHRLQMLDASTGFNTADAHRDGGLFVSATTPRAVR